MKIPKSVLYFILFIPVCLLISTQLSYADNTVKGSLAIDDSKAELNYAYFDKFGEEFTIFLTDNPIDASMIPDGIYSLSEAGKVKALVFTVSRETKQMVDIMKPSIYFNPIWTRNIDIGKSELKISKFDSDTLAGSIKTPPGNEGDGHKISYDVSFNMSLKKETPKLTFKGFNDEPSKTYAEYSKAVISGDIDGFKKYVASANLESLPKDENEIAMGLEFVQSAMMTDFELINSEIKGDNAVLTIKGSKGVTNSDGTIKMVKENGTWKISEESWTLKD